MYSFTKRKQTVEIQPYIRRLCDLTTPNFPTLDGGRTEDRYNRTIPTLLCPWYVDHPVTEHCIIGLTSDLSDRGLGLVLHQPFRTGAVVIGFWLPQQGMCEPWFFFGNIHRNQAIGGGFWTLGIELIEFASPDYAETLAVLKGVAAKLAPPPGMART